MSSGGSIIEQYWAGVQQRLEAEVAVFAELVQHEGERGRENEAALGRILNSFIPHRYGVGTGLLIDSDNQYSRQTDLVIFDRSDEPAALAQTTQLLFPIENVLAAIEVKTTLRKADIEDCTQKQTGMLNLRPARKHPNSTTHPIFVVLAYTTGPLPKTILRHFQTNAQVVAPDLVCILEPGLLLGTAPHLSATRDDHDLASGLALLRDDNGDYVDANADGPDMIASYNGHQYPIVKYGDRHVLVDRSRALLLFVESLVCLLADKQTRPTPAISNYITDEMRYLAPVQ